MSFSDYEVKPLPGCSFFLLYIPKVCSCYEDDGTSLPRPPGSASGPGSLRAAQGYLRLDVFAAPQGLLVEFGRRRSSSVLSLMSCISFYRIWSRASLLRVGYTTPTTTLVRAQLVDAGWRCWFPGVLVAVRLHGACLNRSQAGTESLVALGAFGACLSAGLGPLSPCWCLFGSVPGVLCLVPALSVSLVDLLGASSDDKWCGVASRRDCDDWGSPIIFLSRTAVAGCDKLLRSTCTSGWGTGLRFFNRGVFKRSCESRLRSRVSHASGEIRPARARESPGG